MNIRNFLSAVLLAALIATGCSGRGDALQVHGHPVSFWLEELKNEDARSRQKAVAALAQVVKSDPSIVAPLIGALRDEDAAVRDRAILALANAGPAAKEAVPTLADLAEQDPDATVREHAATALARLR